MTEPHTDDTPRRRLPRGTRVVVILALAIYGWSVVSLLFADFPSPGSLARNVLLRMAPATHTLYERLNRDRLERAARLVRDSAREMSTEDWIVESADSNAPRLPAMLDTAGAVEEGQSSKDPLPAGRVVNIALIGVDSRMGQAPARADAIQVVSIQPDSAIIEILAVPRGTIVGAGYDSLRQNIISYERRRGMTAFLTSLAALCKRGPIPWYVEVGFSQVIGILELLGYPDPRGTLRFLRSRKTFRTGDIQRSWNQAQFLRDNLTQRFSLFRGATGEAAVAAGLRFVSTNLSRDFCVGLVHALNTAGFPAHRSDAVRVRILPRYHQSLLDVHADPDRIRTTSRVSDRIVGDSLRRDPRVAERLQFLLRAARRDSSHPRLVIDRLRVPVSQHIWLQVADSRQRRQLRDGMIGALKQAWKDVGRREEAESLEALREAEDQLLRRHRP